MRSDEDNIGEDQTSSTTSTDLHTIQPGGRVAEEQSKMNV